MAADNTRPVLTDLKIPKSVNVSNGPATARFEATATDTGLGIDFISIRLDKKFIDSFLGAFPFIGLNDGSSTVRVNDFERSTRFGNELFDDRSAQTYHVESVSVFDKGGNFTSYGEDQLIRMGFNTVFEVKDTTRGPGGYVGLDASDDGYEIYRLYSAVLDRKADTIGLSQWVDALQHGSTLLSIAQKFVTSAEFQSKYGGLSDSAFVTALYRNVLDREPDARGQADWTNALATKSRAEVALSFSESAEFKTKILNETPDGIWVQDVQAAQVARLYYATLDRAPEAAGLRSWTSALDGGLSLSDLAKAFTNSAEFGAKYGPNLSDASYVNLLYENVLDRKADAEGANSWTSALGQGLSRNDLALAFSESVEFQHKVQPLLENGFLLS